jgi:hypothetical protein
MGHSVISQNGPHRDQLGGKETRVRRADVAVAATGEEAENGEEEPTRRRSVTVEGDTAATPASFKEAAGAGELQGGHGSEAEEVKVEAIDGTGAIWPPCRISGPQPPAGRTGPPTGGSQGGGRWPREGEGVGG